MFRLELLYANEVKAMLAEFVDNIADYVPLWDDVSEIMVEHEGELFATEGFGLWPPLAPKTVEYKERHGFPLDPMIRTGILLESLTDPTQAARVEQGRSTLGTFTANAFSWGTEVEYAGYHVDGPDHNPDLPIRDLIIVTPGLESRIQRAAEEFADEAARRAGL